MKSIEQEKNISGKRVLLRLDFNVPLDKGKIVDDFRIQAAIPTIQFLRDSGAKTIILSHIEGKPQNQSVQGESGESLKPVAEYLTKAKIPVTFVPEYFTADTQKVLDGMKDGDVVLFENLRNNPGEKENDSGFTKKLAAMGDIYVNDAFPVSHRAHASIVGLPKLLPSFVGPVFMKEVENLSQSFNPNKPFLFILGGAKFDTKMPLIKKFLDSADFIFVGGALANNFFKEQGLEVGQSVVSPGNFDLTNLLKTNKVFIPTDAVVEGGDDRRVKLVNEVESSEKIWDAGPESLAKLGELVKKSKFILWNGPLGNYEDGYVDGTQKLAEIISKSNAKSIVGGGDTVAAIKTLGLMDKFTFVSTGGGAMLDFLVNETLPGIEAM